MSGRSDIAVVGLSFGFPQDTITEKRLWETMINKRCTAIEIPKTRMSAAAIHHPDTSRRGQSYVKKGHFLSHDIAAFDASFFSISSAEAASMDPQHRNLLEYTYKALENAGMPMEDVAGSSTSVYTGCFCNDWERMTFKDEECCGLTSATGSSIALLANRISWFFDLKGTSTNIDTACSSSLVCLDLACNDLCRGASSMSIVAGANLILSPSTMYSLSNMNMISPSGESYGFDHRAQGYSRGEGFAVLLLKRVSDAIRDNDTIRGIIRSTGTNQDGSTTSISLPNALSQEALIKETYRKAKLDLAPVRFFEAHGTGTAVGDPIEAKAIGSVFKEARSTSDPLWVGTIKSNIGHLEGASGLAGVIKTILVLERALIPPNTNFEHPNPKIDVELLRLSFPTELLSWPTSGLRRASVNSFGQGGTNAHAVLDDVFHYLQERNLNANHLTTNDPPNLVDHEPRNEDHSVVDLENTEAKLLIFTSNDETGIRRQVKDYAAYFHMASDLDDGAAKQKLDDLAYTLCLRRSLLSWRSFAVVQTRQDLFALDQLVSPVRKSTTDNGLAFIFTGQGAQWMGMARELSIYPRFRKTLMEIDEVLLGLGCRWRVSNALSTGQEDLDINNPRISQPLCTAVQLALVDVLCTFRIVPSVVVGHSSGEIAAAYCIGAISKASAVKLAYYRGIAADKLASLSNKPGGMLSVGLSPEALRPYLTAESKNNQQPGLTIACYNSPQSVTVSGTIDQIQTLHDLLTIANVYARKLPVTVAYHSNHMHLVARDYKSSLGSLDGGILPQKPIVMISIVTGAIVAPSELQCASYWTENMVSPVKFADAMTYLITHSTYKPRKRLDLSHRMSIYANKLIEIGPQSALQGPVREILAENQSTLELDYLSALSKNSSAVVSLLDMVGHLRCSGYPIDMKQVNFPNEDESSFKVIHDLPSYPFNHSNTYWDESRLSHQNRTHGQGKLDLLGKPVVDWNPFEAKWRNFFRASELPWIEDHIINGSMIYPAAGMIVMAIEAAKQLADSTQPIEGFELQDIRFERPLALTKTSEGVETEIVIRSSQNQTIALSDWSEFKLYAWSNDRKWTECCAGKIRVRYEPEVNTVDGGPRSEELRKCRSMEEDVVDSDHTEIDPRLFYETLRRKGLSVGPSFRMVADKVLVGDNKAVGTIKTFRWLEHQYPQDHVIHPTTLDGFFHISLACSMNNNDITGTMIPRTLGRLFINMHGLSYPDNSDIKVCTWMTAADNRACEFSSFSSDAAGNSILIQMEDLRLTKVADSDVYSDLTLTDQALDCYYIEYLPDPDMLSEPQLMGYRTTPNRSALDQLSDFLDLIAHKKSGLDVLELDIGNLDTSIRILEAISALGTQDQGRIGRYTSYDFVTDSEAALDDARMALEKYPRLNLIRMHLDELSGKTYDLILLNDESQELLVVIQPILKDHGRLIVFGSKSTTIHEKLQMDLALKSFRTHFFGTTSSSTAVSVYSASVTGPVYWNTSRVLFVHNYSENGSEVARNLAIGLGFGHDSLIISLQEAVNVKEKNDLVFVVLLELLEPFLYNISSEDFKILQKFLIDATHVLWITGRVEPEFFLMQGLARALRNEYPEHRYTTIELDFQGAFSQRQMRELRRIIELNHFKQNSGYEPEFKEVDGMLCVPRVVPAPTVTEAVRRHEETHYSTSIAIKDAPPVKLAVPSVGILESITFIEDASAQDELQDDEVEIHTRAIGLNFKDCLTALGQVPGSVYGSECSGYVKRIGKRAAFKIGDRIVLCGSGVFRTVARGKACLAVRIPNSMSFTIAATIFAQFGTAWHVIMNLARLKKHESILIHSGAGGTGQAAIQIARYIGASVFTTVSTVEKKTMLMSKYDIPETHIFYSRNSDFARSIKHVTNDRGVDVVVNSLTGDSLVASWECIAPFGRFIEIGKKDINENSRLPMTMFKQSASFHAFDGVRWTTERPEELRDAMKQLLDLFERGIMSPAYPLHVYGIGEVEQAFRLMQGGAFSGKIVIDVEPGNILPMMLKVRPEFSLCSSSSYVIAGGLGGIGRTTARWMADRGAKNLILLSRFGPRTEEGRQLVDELIGRGVNVYTPACDITDSQKLWETFDLISRSMPPIKGCVQASIIAKDDLFRNLTFEKWKPAVNCKTVGSWNLHTMLPLRMDFFILLSSASGLIGVRGQTNYDAGCTYEDAIARHRVACGEKAIALDLGAMRDDGILAEDPELLSRVLGYGTMEPISRKRYLSLLDYCCNPALPLLQGIESQIAMGMGHGAGAGLDSFDMSRQPLLYPLTRYYRNSEGIDHTSDADNHGLFCASKSLVEAKHVVQEALVEKLGKSLPSLRNAVTIDDDKALQSLGVDSLLAIEIRNWILKEFLADITVFEIQGSTTFKTLGMLVAARSALAHSEWSL